MSNNYLRWLGVGLILVAAVGDSFKPFAFWPIGLPVTIIVLASSIFLLLRINQITVKNTAAIALIVILLIYGLYKNKPYYVLQDFLPIVTSVLLYLCLKFIKPELIVEKLSFYTRIFLVTAFFKVLYIVVFKPAPDWGGTWISANYIIDGGFPRVMLKGSSSVFFISVAFEWINIIKNKKLSLLFLFVGLALIFLDGSRALLAATLVAILLLTAISLKFNRNTILVKLTPIVGFMLLILAFMASASFRSSDAEIRGQFAEVGVESTSAAYRLLEISSAIDSVQNVYTGNGLGASFFALASGAESDDGEGIYLHSFPVWIYFKFGLLGLASTCFIFINLTAIITRNIFRRTLDSGLSIINVFGVFLFSFVCASAVTNLISTFTGAIAVSLLAASVTKRKKLLSYKP
jgi:hypothetical protein